MGIARIEWFLKEVIDRLQPLGIEAALAGIKARSQKRSEKRDQLDFALRQARFEAARAHRQYDAIDPDNRLVAEELERRWNERLLAVRSLETEINQIAGVVTVGLFARRPADVLLVGTADGVVTLTRAA